MKNETRLTPDQQALAAANRGLAAELARRFADRYGVRTGAARADLVGDAFYLLVRAARSYNPDLINPVTGRPYTFGTFAGRTIWRGLRECHCRAKAFGLVGLPHRFYRGRARFDDTKYGNGSAALPFQPAADPAGPDDRDAAAYARRTVFDLLAGLPPKMAAAVRGRLAGQTFAEIGAAQGVSRQNVQARYQAALREMRVKLEDRAARTGVPPAGAG
jgi:RNA polymerase sigma factor (sigma-70 family)